jgi:hypothetical protein
MIEKVFALESEVTDWIDAYARVTMISGSPIHVFPFIGLCLQSDDLIFPGQG